MPIEIGYLLGSDALRTYIGTIGSWWARGRVTLRPGYVS